MCSSKDMIVLKEWSFRHLSDFDVRLDFLWNNKYIINFHFHKKACTKYFPSPDSWFPLSLYILPANTFVNVQIYIHNRNRLLLHLILNSESHMSSFLTPFPVLYGEVEATPYKLTAEGAPQVVL